MWQKVTGTDVSQNSKIINMIIKKCLFSKAMFNISSRQINFFCDPTEIWA